MHEDPVTKSKQVTNSAGTVVSTVELDPWGADTSRSSNAAFQPKKFTSYERDANGTDEAMFRRYNRWQSRFDQPDPYAGSYSLTNPQSFNRYAYTQGDPANFVDPTGLDGDDFLNGYDDPEIITTDTAGARIQGGGGGRSGHHSPLLEHPAKAAVDWVAVEVPIRSIHDSATGRMIL
jgi:RHS repeat-associated protein